MDQIDKSLWINKLWDPLEKIEESPLYSKRQGIKVAAYCRVSADVFQLSQSLESQVSHYTHVIKDRENWTFVGIYFDNMISGKQASLRRGFTRMLRHCEELRIDLILVKNVSRFSRNTKELIETIDRLKNINVTVYFETENIISTNSDTTYLLKTYAGIAQGEIEEISKAIEWGHEKKMLQGVVNIGNMYGYRSNKIGSETIVTIDEVQAPIIKEIYQMFLDGMNYSSIATELTNRRIKTYYGKDHWGPVTIKSILTNISYTGDALARKTTVDLMSNKRKVTEGTRNQYLIEKHHPAIISHEIFNKVQEKIPREEVKPRTTQLITNRFNRRIQCGNCRGKFRRNKTGPWVYFKCASSNLNEGLCCTPTIRNDDMVTLLKRAFTERFNPRDVKVVKTLRRILVKINRNDFFEFHRLKALTQIQLAKTLIDVEYTDEQIDLLEREYRKFESRLEAVEDDRQFRVDAIKWLEEINSFDEFKLKATIDYMRAWILKMVIYSKEDYKIYWIDGEVTEVGSCIPNEPKREDTLMEMKIKGVSIEEEVSVVEDTTSNPFTLDKGGDVNDKEEEIKMVERRAEMKLGPGIMIKNIEKQLSSSVVMRASVPVVKEKKLKVAAYVRVSSDSDLQAMSLKTQYSYYLYRILKEPSYELAGIYVDDGKTGTTTKGRTGFIRIIEDCAAGKIDLIITKSLSRFARNTVDTLKYLNMLDNMDPKVTVLFERENLSTSDKHSNVLISLLSAISQEESRNISESISWGKRSLAQRGIVCRGQIGYGFEKDKNGEWIVDEAKAKVVRRIYEEYLQGLSTRRIAQILTEDKILSPSGNDYWSYRTVDRIIRSEIYRGNYIYQRYHTGFDVVKKRIKNTGELPMYFIENHHPPIVDDQVWEKVQNAIKQREINRKNRAKYTSDGVRNDSFIKAFECGECGTVVGYSRITSSKKSLTTRHTWRCRQSFLGRCESKYVHQEYLENNFMQLLMDFKFNDDFRRHLEAYKKELSIKPEEENRRVMLEAETENLSQKLYAAVEKEIGKEGKNPKVVDELIEKILEIREELDAYIEREEKIDALKKDSDTVLKRLLKVQKENKDEFGFYVNSPEFQEDLFEKLIEKGVLYQDGRISYKLCSGLEWTTELKKENYQEKMKHQRELERIAEKEAYYRSEEIKKLIEYCKTPKTLEELHQYLGKYSTKHLFKMEIINPLMDRGLIKRTIPEMPQSRSQKYYSGSID